MEVKEVVCGSGLDRMTPLNTGQVYKAKQSGGKEKYSMVNEIVCKTKSQMYLYITDRHRSKTQHTRVKWIQEILSKHVICFQSMLSQLIRNLMEKLQFILGFHCHVSSHVELDGKCGGVHKVIRSCNYILIRVGVLVWRHLCAVVWLTRKVVYS